MVRNLEQRPDTVLGLATGGTMEPVYARLVADYTAGHIDFSAIRTFNLDEYVGLAPDDPSSFMHYMRKHFLNRINIPAENAYIPRGNVADAHAEAMRYEYAIVASGGVDLQLLGLGANGHIGFNEPPAILSSLTHVAALTQATRAANARYFDKPCNVPRHAITMGVGTIMRAKEIVLLAIGAEKAEAAANMIEGQVHENCPASALQDHRKVTVVLDQKAAARLKHAR